MEDRELPSNSRSKQPEKKVERVVSSEVIRRKKPLGKRLKDTLVDGDARSVWGFVALDVLVPAAKDMLADAVSQGVERMIFGEARSRSRRGYRPGEGPIAYNRYSSSRHRDDPRERPQLSRRARANHDFEEIVLSTRAEASEVIDRLFDLIAKYEMATVADLYEMVGIQGSYTDDKWGWDDIRGAGVQRVRDGYLLDLPRPEPLS